MNSTSWCASVLLGAMLLTASASPQSREAALEVGIEKVDAALNQLKYAAADKLLAPLLEQTQGAGADAFLLVPLADKYHAVGKHAQAERILRRVIEELEAAPGDTAAGHLEETIFLMAQVLAAQKRYDEAEPLYRRQLAVAEAEFRKKGEPLHLGPANDPDLRYVLEILADFYMSAGRFGDGEGVYKRLLDSYEKSFGSGDPRLAYPLSDLAEALKLQRRYDEAAALYRRALAVEKDSDRALVGLAGLHALQGSPREAELLYKKAIAIQEQTMGSESMEVGNTLEKYAAFLRSLQRVPEAARLEARVKRIKRLAAEPH